MIMRKKPLCQQKVSQCEKLTEKALPVLVAFQCNAEIILQMQKLTVHCRLPQLSHLMVLLLMMQPAVAAILKIGNCQRTNVLQLLQILHD